MPTGVLAIEKFRPELGTLLGVDLVFKARFVGSVCLDNTALTCGPASISTMLLAIVTPSTTNTPAVSGVGVGILSGLGGETPTGFLLGSSDGFDDCATPGVTQGSPSIGDCTPGEDHYAFSFDQTYSVPLASLSGLDLLPWVGPSGSVVSFDSTASGQASGDIHWAVQRSIQLSASVWVEAVYRYCPSSASVGTPYCFCTSGSPCGSGADARGGCASSVGVGAILSGSGSSSISAANLALHGARLPAGQPALFFQANNLVAAGLGAPFGDGLRCAEGSLVRLEFVVSDASGQAATTANLGWLGGAAAGDLRRYQLWYRDPVGSPCGSLFNLTNGLELTWAP